ncbi:TPA: hypothetical protein ACWZ6Y_002052 [Escherichia coli]|nr:hypothetical protein [Escherichia coli]HCN1509562.1 hypothetical protein [Escherichia coli]
MYYPVTDYIALALIIIFLTLTLFICLLCLKHERIKKEIIRRKNAHLLEHGWNAAEFSWFRYGQYNETGIYISIEKTVIVTIAVSGGRFKKEYSIISHMLPTDSITEATLYENGLYTRHIRLSRPVADSKYPLPPGPQLIKNMTLRLRLQDHPEETAVTLFQGKMRADGNNYSIIKGKAGSVLLLLKMLLINHT